MIINRKDIPFKDKKYLFYGKCSVFLHKCIYFKTQTKHTPARKLVYFSLFIYFELVHHPMTLFPSHDMTKLYVGPKKEVIVPARSLKSGYFCDYINPLHSYHINKLSLGCVYCPKVNTQECLVGKGMKS